jgi:hypothetical protein
LETVTTSKSNKVKASIMGNRYKYLWIIIALLGAVLFIENIVRGDYLGAVFTAAILIAIMLSTLEGATARYRPPRIVLYLAIVVATVLIALRIF